MRRPSHRFRWGGIACVLGAATALASGAGHTAKAAVTTPFNAPIAASGGAGSTPTGAAVATDGSVYFIGSTGPGTGCTLFNLSRDGSAATYLGRTPGGAGCAVNQATLRPSLVGLTVTTRSADGTLSGRALNGGASFTWADTSGPIAMGSLAADPAPNAAGTSDLFLLVNDATTGLPQVAVSHDGGATYAVGPTLVNPADIAAGQWQGAGPLPLAGNVVARRDATGLHLYSVVETADSAADRSAQASAKTNNLNRVYAALGTVTPSLMPSGAPTVSWHDVEAYHAPTGTALNHAGATTTVDSAGHVYQTYADGRHVFAKSDLTGLGWDPAVAPVSVDAIAAGLPTGMSASVIPAIAAGGNGKVDLAWYGATGGLATSPNPAGDLHNSWAVFMAQTLDGGATWTSYPVSGNAVHQGPEAGALQLAVDQVSGVAAVAYAGDQAAPGLPSLFATRQCTGFSAVTGLALVDDCVASQPATPVLPGTTCPGPQVRDAAGDALDTSASGIGANVAALDILLAEFRIVDPSTELATLTVNRMSTALPVNVAQAQWRLTWTQGATEHYAQAVMNAGQTPVYSVGTVNPDGTLGAGAPVQGALIPGANGAITFTLPRALIGNPATGSSLQNISAATYAVYSAQGSPTAQLVDRAPDGGAGADYAVAQVCAPLSNVPEIPAAALLPLVGGATAIAVAVKRRRSRRTVS
jgi:hypothetical protein